MIIDRDTFPDKLWRVVHVPTARMLTLVRWVNTDDATYCVYRVPFEVACGDLVCDMHQARRIDAHFELDLILIDPVEGVEPESLTTQADQPQSVEA